MGRTAPNRVTVPPGADAEGPLAGLESPESAEYLELEDPGDIAALQDQRFESWTWYVWRQPPVGQGPEKRDASRGPSYVAKLFGPLDIEDIRARCGGGHYKIAGYVNGRKLRGFMLDIDGPPRVAPVEQAHSAPPAPSAPPAAGAAVSSELATLTAQLGQAVATLTELARRPPPEAAKGQPMGLKELLQLLPLIQREPAPVVGADTLKELVGVMKLGVELGQGGAGVESNPWLQIVDRLAPMLQTIATGMSRRAPLGRRAPRPAPPADAAAWPHPNTPPAAAPAAAPGAEAPAAPSSSRASVVEDEPGDAERWAVAVDALARAIAEGVEPDSFAGVLEHILSEPQLTMLVSASTDQVMGELSEVVERFPVFATAEARAFVDAVLSELRTVEEDEAETEPTPA